VGEQPIPTTTVTKDNPAQIERGNTIFEALQFATGSRKAALDLLRQIGPLPEGIQRNFKPNAGARSNTGGKHKSPMSGPMLVIYLARLKSAALESARLDGW
jgi:hypothetical protein